jgi:hypothetical protein
MLTYLIYTQQDAFTYYKALVEPEISFPSPKMPIIAVYLDVVQSNARLQLRHIRFPIKMCPFLALLRNLHKSGIIHIVLQALRIICCCLILGRCRDCKSELEE